MVGEAFDLIRNIIRLIKADQKLLGAAKRSWVNELSQPGAPAGNASAAVGSAAGRAGKQIRHLTPLYSGRQSTALVEVLHSV